MTEERETLIQVLYGKAASWPADFVLKKGEHGYEWDENRFKIGDDVTPYAELDYYVPESRIKELIEAAIADLPVGGGGGISATTFNAHVNSPTPHPAYDNMPSLLSRYRSRKV